jgi:hypothetical protein
MNSVSEIESAIQQLPLADLEALLAWLEEYRALVGASETLFRSYDTEETHVQSPARGNLAG